MLLARNEDVDARTDHPPGSRRVNRATVSRVALAGPGAAIVAVLVVLAMPLWVPAGVAKVDNLVLPLFLFPLIWAAVFFHACLDPRLGRVAVVALVLTLLHGGLLAWHFAGSAA